MEEQTQKRLDSVLEDELQKGYRLKIVPEALSKQLEAECGAVVTRVRFTRLNPARRRKIAQAVQRQYHKDLQNPDILSHEQILKLVSERGEWTTAMDEEMATLQQSTNREMGDLFINGIAQDNWTMDLMEAASAFRLKVQDIVPDEDEQQKVLSRFDRWLEYSADRREQYTEQYAAEQGREQYSPDYDLQKLMNAVSDVEAVEHLNTIDELRDKLHRYIKLQTNRLKLAELQLRHAKIFAESVEQRRDNMEEMSRLYYITEQVDENGKPTGPLCKELEQLWDFPEPVIQWFLVEAYFFLNGIPDEAREYLQTFGFLKADAGEETIQSPSGESEPSAESPAPPTSRLDSSPAVETVSASSVSPPATTLTTVK